MIRILNIIDTMGSGGVERRRLSMAKLLDKEQFELKIICTNKVGVFPDEFRIHNVEVIAIGDLKSVFDYKQYLKVMKIMHTFKPHIVHGAVFEGVTMTAIAGFLKNVPVIILEETSDPQNRSWKGNLLLRLLSLLADKVIGVSPAATNYLLHKIHIPNRKVQLINNGVAIPEPTSAEEQTNLRDRLLISNHEIVIGSVGRMSSDAHKRFSDLIKAMAILNKKNLPIKLILVGDGPEQTVYKNLVYELDLQNKVVFAGYQNEVSQFYSVFDIFCLTSAFEAFGLVIAEAMLHQLPVVATKVGGMQYIVDHDKTGFLVEKCNVQAIAQALEILCLDKQKRIRFGANGLEKATEKYTEKIYIAAVQKLYFELMKNKKLT
jgi:glycosyltransferase involved in cell wall biosynthesis